MTGPEKNSVSLPGRIPQPETPSASQTHSSSGHHGGAVSNNEPLPWPGRQENRLFSVMRLIKPEKSACSTGFSMHPFSLKKSGLRPDGLSFSSFGRRCCRLTDASLLRFPAQMQQGKRSVLPVDDRSACHDKPHMPIKSKGSGILFVYIDVPYTAGMNRQQNPFLPQSLPASVRIDEQHFHMFSCQSHKRQPLSALIANDPRSGQSYPGRFHYRQK